MPLVILRGTYPDLIPYEGCRLPWDSPTAKLSPSMDEDDPLRVTWLPLPCAVGAQAALSRPVTSDPDDPDQADDEGHHPTVVARIEEGGFIRPCDVPTSTERDLAREIDFRSLELPLGSRAIAYIAVPLASSRIAKFQGACPDGLLVLWHGEGYAITAPVADWKASMAWPWPTIASYYVGVVLVQSRDLVAQIATLA